MEKRKRLETDAVLSGTAACVRKFSYSSLKNIIPTLD